MPKSKRHLRRDELKKNWKPPKGSKAKRFPSVGDPPLAKAKGHPASPEEEGAGAGDDGLIAGGKRGREGAPCPVDGGALEMGDPATTPRASKTAIGPLSRIDPTSGEVTFPPGTWRGFRRSLFDDSRKNIFLTAIAQHGRLGHAAEAAAVCVQTVRDHLQKDTDFADAHGEAIEQYRAKVMETAYKVGVEGVKEPIMGGRFKDQVVGYKTIYATNILAMELKRVERSYRDQSTIDVNVNHGVLVAPATQPMEDWLKTVEGHHETPAPAIEHAPQEEDQPQPTPTPKSTPAETDR